MMHKAPNIGYRAYEEMNRIIARNGTTVAQEARRLRLSPKLYGAWMNGAAPTAYSLAKLHACGYDVLYILSGVRGD